jgi:hypothetical protein
MANTQKYLEDFDSAIALGRFEENATLRQKRDIIREKLEARLRDVFEEHGEECPEFYFRDQGSYDLGTGVKPVDGDFDIDQGLYFGASTDMWPDPVTPKMRVHEALDGHTKEVRIRRPCVTVFYQQDGEPIYHVDIAVYSDGAENADGKHRLAMGKENSAEELRIWEASDPQALKDKTTGRFEGNDREQFRRIVRYLKRWKDVNFPPDGNAAPLGIGLTILAHDELQPRYADTVSGTPDDLGALRHLAQAILNRFGVTWDEDEATWIRRLVVKLLVEPWNDLFERMTGKQMEQVEQELGVLLEALNSATDEVDPVEACKRLSKVFGKDFPVPRMEDTGKRHAPAIVSSSNSA